MSKPARGYIIGPQGRLVFEYNPPEFSVQRSVNYVTHSAPGVEYPRTQFVSGDVETFPLDLFLANENSIEQDILFIESMAPPRANTVLFSPPPIMLFSYGTFVRRVVLVSYNITRNWFDKSLNPLRAEVRLDFRVVL